MERLLQVISRSEVRWVALLLKLTASEAQKAQAAKANYVGHVVVAAIEARGSSEATALSLGIDLKHFHRLRKQNKSTIPHNLF